MAIEAMEGLMVIENRRDHRCPDVKRNPVGHRFHEADNGHDGN